MAGSSRKAHDFLRSIKGFTEANADPNVENRRIRLGTVDYDYDPNDFLGGIYPRIMFDGEKIVSQKRYKTTVGYYPLPGHRVVLVPVGTTYLIIGTVSQAPQDPKVDIFATTGTDTWEKPQGARTIRVQVQAGGGAGGGAPTTTAGQTAAGGGGAGGSYGETWFPATEVASSITVTVGVGGTAVALTTGGNGGASSFGSLVTASAGNGGGVTAAGTTNTGVNGADSTGQTVVGDIAIKGGGGGAAMRLATQGALGGVGGSSQMGNGARGKAVTTGVVAGDLGQGYGGGGSGGVNGSTGNTGVAGGDGAPGIVIVTTYF